MATKGPKVTKADGSVLRLLRFFAALRLFEKPTAPTASAPSYAVAPAGRAAAAATAGRHASQPTSPSPAQSASVPTISCSAS